MAVLSAPLLWFVKLNTNVSYDHLIGVIRLGMVIRNFNAEVLLCALFLTNIIGGPFHVEIFAIKHGLDMVVLKGYRNILVKVIPYR